MWLVSDRDGFFAVIDQVGAVRERFDSGDVHEDGVTRFRHYVVEHRELLEMTYSDWARWTQRTVMGGLFVDRTEETRRFLEAIDLPIVRRAMERQFARVPAGGVLRVVHDHGELFRRAQDVLTWTEMKSTGPLRDALARGLLEIGRANPGGPAVMAYVRACLLACGERDALPEIDETWVPVSSPLAEQVAELATMLDDGDQGDAADAMHTCAVLLGYRPRK